MKSSQFALAIAAFLPMAFSTVLPAGAVPLARNDRYPVNQGVAAVLAVLVNDTDPGGGALTVSVSGVPTSHGSTVSANTDNTVTFVPAPGYYGPDSFSYTVTDSSGATATADVSVNVRPVGAVWTWGSNQDGQLGIGPAPDALSPVAVTGVPNPVAVAACGMQSLALSRDGGVWQWGNMGGSYPSSVNLSGVMDVACGGFNMAVRYDGTVWAWGQNPYGNLGNGTTTDSGTFTTVQVSGITDAVAIAAGVWHALALRADGTVVAWGWNSNGQLGDGTTTDRHSPVPVTGLTNVIAIAAGAQESLAVTSDGALWAWGNNDSGQLGNGTFTRSLVPVQVPGISNVTGMAAGAHHTLALTADGTVWAWGYNLDGELGDGTTVYKITPEAVVGPSGIRKVGAGDWHSLAAIPQQYPSWAKAWGKNDSGQLGNTTTVNSSSPVLVNHMIHVSDVAGGTYHSAAISINHTPVAADDSYSVAENGTLTVAANGVLTNDTDADADGLSFSLASWPSHGSLSPVSNGAFTYTPAAGFSGTDTFTYRATDGMSSSDASTVSITVTATDLPPTVSISGPAAVDEGAIYALDVSAIDPDGPDYKLWTVNWGDGTPAQTFAGNRVTHIYADGPSTATITASVSDTFGVYQANNVHVAVNNVAPTAAITAPASGALSPVNTGIAVQGSFTDPGTLDTHTARWSFVSANQSLSFMGTVDDTAKTVFDGVSFSTPGVYAITLDVTDKDNASGEATMIGDLPAYVVVYDPTGGYVTGGGWINSPAGAYAADPAMTGKASFGFEAKYQKGANVPTGNTEFQFKAGNLNFKSTSYQWLVVAGARAQYKGSGTINGSGDYGFLLTAIDGQVNGGGGADRFRIKISDKSTGAVVYDNQYGAGDNDALSSSTIIGGGSILIHAG